MDTLTIASQKGGVGKTVLALNLGWALAQQGKRVLVMDTDPQSGLSRAIASKLVERKGFADVLAGDITWREAIIATRQPGFSILPLGQVPPWEAAVYEAQLADGTAFTTLKVATNGQYDVLIIDTPAGLGSATLGAMRAANYVISPIQAEPGSLRAATAVIDVLNHFTERDEPTAHFLGYVLGMINRKDETSRAIVNEAWDVFPDELLFDTTIPRHNLFLEANSRGIPVAALGQRAQRLGLIFEQLAAEVTMRMEANR